MQYREKRDEQKKALGLVATSNIRNEEVWKPREERPL